jgi:hypothetical protein
MLRRQPARRRREAKGNRKRPPEREHLLRDQDSEAGDAGDAADGAAADLPPR